MIPPNTPRESQQRVIDYTGGYLGISAVPGSGKTWTLSQLTAKLIGDGKLESHQRVLIVTFANSSVENFSRQINVMIKEAGFLPGFGYKVRTLHGIAHDILKARPGLVGVSEDFSIIDDHVSKAIINGIVNTWWNSNQNALNDFLIDGLYEAKLNNLRDNELRLMLHAMNNNLIKYAKDNQITTAMLESKLNEASIPVPLIGMFCSIYRDYQKALAYKGALDFSDLVFLANKTLSIDEKYLQAIRNRWPYVFEDEAQDSNPIQEGILRKIAGPKGNWVRVGDPNQAVYETFTTANPKFFKAFILEATSKIDLPFSGRSSVSIINLANHLIQWTIGEHPNVKARDALALPLIKPTVEGDLQPNPAENETYIGIVEKAMTDNGELEFIAKSCEEWINLGGGQTAAILVPSNTRGFEVVTYLKSKGIDAIDSLLRSSIETRKSAGGIAHILSYLSEPYSGTKLSTVYRVYRKDERIREKADPDTKVISDFIAKQKNVEGLVWPKDEASRDWVNHSSSLSEIQRKSLYDFILKVQTWLSLRLLPIDQIILALAQEIYTEPEKLAISHRFALLLKTVSLSNPGWGLKELTNELILIADNKRGFLGISPEDSGFNPNKFKDQIVVSTIHKAKGLEWDRVYLLSVNNYHFPSGSETDRYISEKWFIRDNLNLAAEVQEQLDSIVADPGSYTYFEGQASNRARHAYAKERLKLFYVGITRAKRELIITWTSGSPEKNPNRTPNTPSIPFTTLANFVKGLNQ